MPHRLARTAAVIVLATACSGLLGSVAAAQPVTDLQAQATALNAQIQANGAKISALGEQINGAQLKLQAAQAQMNQLEGRLRGRAAIIYRTNGQGGPADFSTSNALEMLVRSKYSSIIAGNDRRSVIAPARDFERQLRAAKPNHAILRAVTRAKDRVV